MDHIITFLKLGSVFIPIQIMDETTTFPISVFSNYWDCNVPCHAYDTASDSSVALLVTLLTIIILK